VALASAVKKLGLRVNWVFQNWLFLFLSGPLFTDPQVNVQDDRVGHWQSCSVRYQLGKLSDIVARFSEPKALFATQQNGASHGVV